MKKKTWAKVITENCKAVGTYKPAFDPIIESLASLLEVRDDAMKEYDGRPLVEHTNSHGETNMVKNPAIMLFDEYNKTALLYWRDLGLTPSGLKKINSSELTANVKVSKLDEVLSKMTVG